jgi:hypothetical protein
MNENEVDVAKIIKSLLEIYYGEKLKVEVKKNK